MKKAIKLLLWIILLTLIIATVLGHLGLGNKFSNETISINGEQLRLLQKGEGQPILFIHGTPGSIEDWTLYNTCRPTLAY